MHLSSLTKDIKLLYSITFWLKAVQDNYVLNGLLVDIKKNRLDLLRDY